MKAKYRSVAYPADLYSAIIASAKDKKLTVSQWLRWAARAMVVTKDPRGVPMQGIFTETINYDDEIKG